MKRLLTIKVLRDNLWSISYRRTVFILLSIAIPIRRDFNASKCLACPQLGQLHSLCKDCWWRWAREVMIRRKPFRERSGKFKEREFIRCQLPLSGQWDSWCARTLWWVHTSWSSSSFLLASRSLRGSFVSGSILGLGRSPMRSLSSTVSSRSLASWNALM